MYIKEKFLKGLKISIAVVSAITVFWFAASIMYIGSMMAFYTGDMETVKRSVSYESSKKFIVVLPFVILLLNLIRKCIEEAFFYNSYFEGDLNGLVSYKDLSGITGDSEKVISNKIKIYRAIFMKNFSVDSDADENQIKLNSKMISCQCRNCGAEIEKSKIFVGKCAYCDSSDLTAKVITSERFYNIDYENKKDKNNSDYLCKHFKGKVFTQSTIIVLMVLISFILVAMSIDYAANYNNEEYVRELMRNDGYSTLDLEQGHMRSQIVFNLVFAAAAVSALVIAIKKLTYLLISRECSFFFAKAEKPFNTIITLFKSNKEKAVRQTKLVKKSICKDYLKNCSFEKHKGHLYVTIGRKVTKDKCPNCNGAITDPVHENYVCKYCGTKIMGVVEKK